MATSVLETRSYRHRLQTNPQWWALASNRRRFANRLECLLKSVLRSELTTDDATKLYVVLASELRAGMSPKIAGAVHPYFPQHPMIRAAIGKRDRGPGPVVLVNDSNFGSYPEWESSELTHIAIHEAAHLCTFPTMLVKTPISQLVSGAIVDQISSAPVTWLSKSEAYGQHDWRFIRALLHLADRCGRRGASVNPYKLFNWQSYGYTDPLRYRSLLAAEMGLRVSVRSIMQRPAPKAFLDLWTREVETARATNNPLSPESGFLQ